MPKKRSDADLAAQLCHAIRANTSHRRRRSPGCVQWAALSSLEAELGATHEELERAVRFAVTEDWLDIDPGKPPHSVCLTAGYWLDLAA